MLLQFRREIVFGTESKRSLQETLGLRNFNMEGTEEKCETELDEELIQVLERNFGLSAEDQSKSDDDDLDDDDDHFGVDQSNGCADFQKLEAESDDDIMTSIKDEIMATKSKLASLEASLANKALQGKKPHQQKNTNDRLQSLLMSKNPKDNKTKYKQQEEIRDPDSKDEIAETTLESNRNRKSRIEAIGDSHKGDDDSMKHKAVIGKVSASNHVERKRLKETVPGNTDELFKKIERMAHKAKHEHKMNESDIKKISCEKKRSNMDWKQNPTVEEKIWQTEAYSGIRIINPSISSTQMEAKMEGRRFIKLNALSRYIVKGDVSGDWVTMGVVVVKLPPKTSANGKIFSIWKLSDLIPGHENETTSFFLFGDIHKEHWKVNEGTVIALLNSSIMPQRDNGDVGAVAITIDNPQKMMVMGISKDFGICKGVTRKGNQCSYIVNKIHGDFCEYHISREHKKTMASRMEFQSSSTGPEVKRGKLMQAVKKDINSGQVCYAGKTLTWSDKADKKKKIDAKKSILNTMAGDRSKLCDKNKGKSIHYDDDKDDTLSEDFKTRLKVPTLGSRNLLKFLQKDEDDEKEKLAVTKTEVKSAKDLINEQKGKNKATARTIGIALPFAATANKPVRKFSANFKPTIGGSLSGDDFIEFCDSDDVVSDALNSKSSFVAVDTPKTKGPPVKKPSPVDNNHAKVKAINLLRNSEISIDRDPMGSNGKKKSPKEFAKIKERVVKDISNEEQENSQPPKKKRKGILGEIFGELDLKSEEGKKLIEMKSRNNHYVQIAEAEREQAYFNVLEKKEMYEQKMNNIMEQKVKAICCKICKYMHEFQSSFCRDQGHPIVRVDATKRFFICKNCKNRLTSFKKLPVQSCRYCGSTNFERTSMFQEKKGPKIGGETLLVRGEEHSIFLNSLK